MYLRVCKYIIAVALFSCFGCGFDKKEKSNVPIVYLDPTDKLKECLLSQVAQEPEVISLETNLDCMIGNFSWLIFMNKENIIYRSDKTVLIFDGKGHFINKIDAVGNGPGEYTNIMGIAVDPVIKNIFILDNDAIKVFHFNGEFIKKIKLGFFPSGLYRTKDGQNFVSVSQSYNQRNRDMLVLYDVNFKKVKSVKSRNLEDFKEFKQDFFFGINPYEVDKKIFYNEPYVDTIFEISGRHLKPHWIIDSGKYKMKITDGLNVENLHKASEKDKITLPGIMETNKYFFFGYYYKKESCYSIFSKDQEKMILHQRISSENPIDGNTNFGLKNDLIQNGPSFWPDYFTENKMVKVIFPHTLTATQRLAFKCKESDNPILMIVSLK